MNVQATRGRDTRGVRAGIGIVLGIAAALRLWHLGARSLWTDEASAWTASHGSITELLRFCVHEDASPPLFYLLTSVALRFGDSEAHLRAVSVIASLAIVWITYRFARLYAGRGESLLAATLVTLSAYQVMYAQEARTYMLVAAWMTLATFLFARIAWHGRAHYWPFYALAIAGALYTQTIGLLVVGTHGALVLLTPSGRRAWRGFALALLGASALYAPWLIASMQQAGHLPQSHWYIPSPDAHGTFLVLRAILVSPLSLVSPTPAGAPGLGTWMPAPFAHGLLAIAPLVPLVVSLPALVRTGPRADALRLAAAAVLLPLIAVFLVSLQSPLWLPRYFVFTTPFLALLIACGLMRLRPVALRTGWIGLLLAVSLFALWRYDTAWTKEAWRAAARHIATQSIAGGSPRESSAVLVPFDGDAMRYYFRSIQDAPAVFEVSHSDDPFASAFTPRQIEEIIAVARARSAAFEHVWVVERSANSDVRREVMRRTEAVAAEGRAQGEAIVFESYLGPVRVAQFTRQGAATAP